MELSVENVKNRLTIMNVGVQIYNDETINPLLEVQRDMENIEGLFISSDLALYQECNYIKLENPTSAEFREEISKYSYERSAAGDFLILYFSGHGAIFGLNEFGFSLKDTLIHKNYDIVLPTSIVSINEIIKSLAFIDVTPIFIIDACHSGLLAKASVSLIETIGFIYNDIHQEIGSKFAFLCACASDEVTPNTSLGGYFTRKIMEILGNENEFQNQPYITLTILRDELNRMQEYEPKLGIEPRIFISASLENFPVCKNRHYKPQLYHLADYQILTLEALWNEGNPQSLRPSEILQTTENQSSYGNHRKLSLPPWNLVEDIGNRRGLTDEGIQFMNNIHHVPSMIIQDDNGVFVPSDDSKMVTYDDLQDKQLSLFDREDA